MDRTTRGRPIQALERNGLIPAQSGDHFARHAAELRTLLRSIIAGQFTPTADVANQ